MEKFEIDGKTYIYHNGHYLDDCYCQLCTSELMKVLKYKFNQIDYKNLSKTELIELIKHYKENEVFSIAKTVAEFSMKTFDYDNELLKTLLPIYTSCCRKLNMPEEAIKVTNKYINSSTSSPALNTSLAASYCDIKDYETALKYAGRAYAKLALLPPEYKVEISNVYARIRAESDLLN